ncbi:hypothetical protein GCU67_15530 [Modestobacter muralis]|uniref:Uncharacterized protein n=1 Tax=Modestobacter muralis TaxID=1608614 RepID=A0A6P0EYL4_9ACTN|nr:hypothetical protein [Modestobacter muralis]NEK95566.1 hypothetical protein [Modestobacter muralis]NEN52454.1 hypothetical protein [Modestobacter muralis]
MDAILGLVVSVAGVAVLVFAPRLAHQNEAGSRVLGRFDPYARRPRFMRAWSLAITRAVGGLWIILGLLAVVGVVDWV